MAFIPTPEACTYAKGSSGISDTTIVNGVYKFLGASIISANMTLGFNGNASSLSITLVEDTANGDSFINPEMPSLWAFSLPKGGLRNSNPIFWWIRFKSKCIL